MAPVAFDGLTRTVSTVLSRRSLASVLGVGTLSLPALAAAKKKRKSKIKIRRNAFGCVSVGKACRGKDANCCSGICKGKKPRKGEKDTSRCVAHDTGGCLPGKDICDAFVACTTSAGNTGHCGTTTGNAGYCFDVIPGLAQRCRRDPDCREALGASAACVYCPGSDFGGCLGIQPS
jgi:hypothetical protein